jgi:hypothetical protein
MISAGIVCVFMENNIKNIKRATALETTDGKEKKR